MAVAVDLTGLQVSKTLSIMTRGGIYGDMKPGSWAYIWPVDAPAGSISFMITFLTRNWNENFTWFL